LSVEEKRGEKFIRIRSQNRKREKMGGVRKGKIETRRLVAAMW